ncbi:MAG: hypothetical protein OEM26_00240 [Saprospiraceae bacterium]|nr:hypothetical protein [Saprospiraceae bacterium]
MSQSVPFLDELLQRFHALNENRRFLVGLIGPPGSGKSYWAEELIRQIRMDLGSDAADGLGMDGYHMHNDQLIQKGLYPFKGSHFTFEAARFVQKVKELMPLDRKVSVPIYDRSLHNPTPNGKLISRSSRIVVLEGNYLLTRISPWDQIRNMLDYSVYIEVQEDIQYERLMERHTLTGKSTEEARYKIIRTDWPNSELIVQSRDLADFIFRPAANFSSD